MHRLSHEEVGQIARLAAKRGIDRYGDGPSVQQASALLGLPPEQVERLLAEVRQKAPVDPASLRTALMGLGGALAVLALIVVATLVAGSRASGDATSKAPAEPTAGLSASVPGGTASYGMPPVLPGPQPSNAAAYTATDSRPLEPTYVPAPKTPLLKSDETELRRAGRMAKEYAETHRSDIGERQSSSGR